MSPGASLVSNSPSSSPYVHSNSEDEDIDRVDRNGLRIGFLTREGSSPHSSPEANFSYDSDGSRGSEDLDQLESVRRGLFGMSIDKPLEPKVGKGWISPLPALDAMY